MSVLAEIGKDSGFLDLLFEALERALKVFFVVDDDFGQTRFPLGGPPRGPVERGFSLGRRRGIGQPTEGQKYSTANQHGQGPDARGDCLLFFQSKRPFSSALSSACVRGRALDLTCVRPPDLSA